MTTRRARLLAGSVGVAVAGTALIALTADGPPSSAAAQQPPTAARTAQPDRTFTLITGDRVVLRQGDPHKASVIPGRDRAGIRFRQVDTGRRVTIVPSDAEPLIGAGRLDQRLSDLTRLAADELDDSRTKELPLLVQYTSHRPRALAGTRAGRQLPRFGGAAVQLPKH